MEDATEIMTEATAGSMIDSITVAAAIVALNGEVIKMMADKALEETLIMMIMMATDTILSNEDMIIILRVDTGDITMIGVTAHRGVVVVGVRPEISMEMMGAFIRQDADTVQSEDPRLKSICITRTMEVGAGDITMMKGAHRERKGGGTSIAHVTVKQNGPRLKTDTLLTSSGPWKLKKRS